MANSVLSLTLMSIIVISLPALGSTSVKCNGPCQIPDNFDDDICEGGGSGGCDILPEIVCEHQTFSRSACSPPVTDRTEAYLTKNEFQPGGSGGGPSKCDGLYHDNTERIVALSTGWFNCNSSCGQNIIITAPNGRTTTAMVVDECDSTRGCDQEHGYLSPCDTNIVDASIAVLDALGLGEDDYDGMAPITWSMA